MPRIERTQWYDLARDMNWHLSYVTEEEAFPEALSGARGIQQEAWWNWDEPYKISYREYVHNQVSKDTGTYSIKGATARTNMFENLDPGWKSAVIAHYGGIAMAEHQATLGESRMGRFGRAAAWRNMATFGTLDEMRHGQIQTYFPYTLLEKEPRADWAHRTYHTNNWVAIVLRRAFEDMFTGNDAVATALQLTFTLETGFTNLQFLGLAADALEIGDVEFGALISSIQTDEARHAQLGEPTLRLMIENGRKKEAQELIDHAFWISWRLFSVLTGMSMDYYTPLEHRSMSFKEFNEEWIIKQFLDQFRDFGLEKPWYWEQFLAELNWYHHAIHLGVWFWRPTVWWNPDAGISPAERDWLETRYPGWNETFGKNWDVIIENVRQGKLELTYPETFPVPCNMCQIPIVTPAGKATGYLHSAVPHTFEYKGRTYTFCSEPCKWIFERNPERFADHLTIVERLTGGLIQPPTMAGALAYMGLAPGESGDDATNYAWAKAEPSATPPELAAD